MGSKMCITLGSRIPVFVVQQQEKGKQATDTVHRRYVEGEISWPGAGFKGNLREKEESRVSPRVSLAWVKKKKIEVQLSIGTELPF